LITEVRTFMTFHPHWP